MANIDLKSQSGADINLGSSVLNMKINIGDAWKDVVAVKINIGDVWKDVTAVVINV